MLHGVCIALLFLGGVTVAIPEMRGAGADRVQSESLNLIPDQPAIANALKAYLLGATPWKESEIDIRSVGNLDDVRLPTQDAQMRLAPGASFAGRRKVLAPVEIIQSGRVVRSIWITAEISIRAQVLTATKKIPANKILDADDVAERVVEIPDFRISYPRRPEELVGKVARRSFSTGMVLTREAFVDPFLVRHGETIQLRLERRGIVVTTPAKAEQDGKLGQVITVRNLESSAALKAQVIGPGSVRIP